MQRADQRTYHYIYKITRDDGKYYIGMHSTDNIEDDYFGSGKLITRSIKKYGVKRHQKEILEFLPSRIALKERERQLVNEEIVADPKCMNLQLGGGGGLTTVEHAKAFHRAGRLAMENALTAEQKTIRSTKAFQTQRDRGTARTSWGSEAVEAARFSEKRKITMKERGHMQGEKNSQFGTCWVTDGSKAVKIKKNLLDEYLAKGYLRGRTVNARIR